MWLSVDSEVAGHKRKLKGLSPEITIERADIVDGIESNINIFDMREYIDLSGVVDHGMLYIVMMYQLGRPYQFFYAEKSKD